MKTVPRALPVDDASGTADSMSGSMAASNTTQAVVSQQAALLTLVAEILEEPTLQSALDTFAGLVKQLFTARRVVVALADNGGRLQLGAISQRSLIDQGAVEIRLLLDAMEETSACECLLQYPQDAGDIAHLPAHKALIAGRSKTRLASVPLYDRETLTGVLLLECDAATAFSRKTSEQLEHIALASGRLLALHREADRGGLSRIKSDTYSLLKRRFGSTHPGASLLLAMAVIAVILGLTVPVEQRVSAVAELAPRERRLVTAPVAGFVDAVLVSAGERVTKDQVLARLDRRELELQALREAGEMLAAQADLRAAMAGRNRQASAVARARVEQERAQQALVEFRLTRSELRAPIAGLITNGDPQDAVGAPIERGQTLFEIVPDDTFEVNLLVQARDIRDVREGQTGSLMLEGRAGEHIKLVVRSIHPVAESGNGETRFRVKADLLSVVNQHLRPGESGFARLAIGQTSFLRRLAQPIFSQLDEFLWRWIG